MREMRFPCVRLGQVGVEWEKLSEDRTTSSTNVQGLERQRESDKRNWEGRWGGGPAKKWLQFHKSVARGFSDGGNLSCLMMKVKGTDRDE